MLQIYNTLNRKKEKFVPLREGRVGIYVCGPTVYDYAHIGHAKSYVFFDVVVRYLRYLGYQVRYVQNITDVGHLTDNADQGEDKVEKKAKLERVEPMELVEKYTRSYFEDMDALGIVRPNISPHASGHIPEQIALIETLLKKGFAYSSDGSVYFSVDKFPDYGKLSGRRQKDQIEGARIPPDPAKRNPTDFALWKKAEKGHILKWNSPWGEGYPGWHLECSTMSMKYLGDTLDIHGGGMENQFPHHECEIAQSEAATGKPFVRYWMHNNMVTVNGTKMSKSLGNFVTLKDVFKEINPQALRLLVLNSHYRSLLDFSNQGMQTAEQGFKRLVNAVRRLTGEITKTKEKESQSNFVSKLKDMKVKFLAAMNDDLNTPVALALLFELGRFVNKALHSEEKPGRKDLKFALNIFKELGEDILGFDFSPINSQANHSDQLINLLVELREKLRAQKNYPLADKIREDLRELGIILEDSPEGTEWRWE